MDQVMTTNRVEAGAMAGVQVVELKLFPDSRGDFRETYRESWFPGRRPMVQGNGSRSQAGVLRGLHFHRKQADYWYVPFGRVLAALADLRVGSATQGKVALLEMGEGQERGLYIPPGVAHGYYALSDSMMTYLVDEYYDNSDEFGVAWDDPDLAIDWPGEPPILSERDQTNPRVADLDPGTLVSL